MRELLESRVKTGIALLNTKTDVVGEDWFNKIDLDKLDMGSPVNCILGQLIGWDKSWKLFRSVGPEHYHNLCSHGFDLSADDLRFEGSYVDLLDIWLTELQELRNVQA